MVPYTQAHTLLAFYSGLVVVPKMKLATMGGKSFSAMVPIL